jgi:hypothetical protein
MVAAAERCSKRSCEMGMRHREMVYAEMQSTPEVQQEVRSEKQQCMHEEVCVEIQPRMPQSKGCQGDP